MPSRPAKILGPNGKPFPSRERPDAFTGKYDAAQTTPENAAHWSNADALSARAANSPEVRRTLRNRSRYERDNNCFCSGMLETISTDLIGTGPRLLMKSEDRELNKLVMRRFRDWSGEMGLASKLITMREAKSCDGEGFAAFKTNPALSTPVKLDIEAIEADQVATPDLWQSERGRIDGIHFDSYGNPSAYDILEDHPGDSFAWGGSWGRYRTVPASVMLHWFKARRPGQYRGIPETTPALPLFALLRRFTLATVSAAEIAALFSAVLETNLDAFDDADTDPDDPIRLLKPFQLQQVVRGMMTALPEGYKLNQFKSEHPSTTYEMFRDAIVNEIARALNVPYNVAIGKSAGYNFASGRLDHQSYHRMLKIERFMIGVGTLDRIFREWLREARIADRDIRAMLGPGRELPEHSWHWDGFPAINPVDEVNAQEKRITLGLTSRAKECAEMGNDFREVADQELEVMEYYNEIGLPYPGGNPGVAPDAGRDAGAIPSDDGDGSGGREDMEDIDNAA